MSFYVRKFVLLVIAICFGNRMVASQGYDIDSLASAVYSVSNGTERLEMLDILSGHHENVDSTLKFAQMELDLAQQLNVPEKRANAARFIGWAYCFKNDIDKAFDYIVQANDLYAILNDSLNIAHCCNMLGNILAMKGSSANADGFYNRALELYKLLDREELEAEIYRNMGHQCLVYKVYDRAYEHFGRALDIDRRLENTEGVSEDLYSLGYGQLLQCIDEEGSIKQLERAKKTLVDSYAALSDNQTTHYLRVCSALSDVYLEQAKKSDKAQRRSSLDSCNMYIAIGYEIIGQISASGYKPTFDLRKARYNLACGDYMSSIQMLQNLEPLAEESDLMALTREELFYAFTEYYEVTGNYRMAYSYSKKINELNRRKNNDGYLVNSTQAKIQSEYDEEMRQRDMLFEKKSKRMTSVIVLSLLVIALLLFMVIGVLRVSVRSRRYNKILNENNLQLARQQNEILEQNVLLNQKTEEIRIQRDEIEGQRNYLSSQNSLIRNANRLITDSLLYAKKIQEAVIPSEEMMKSIFGECLVFWRPLNIVSGDFYWAAQVGRYKLLAVADCTGHGVPGGFMSMLGMSLLNDIVSSGDISQMTAASVLDNLRTRLKTALRQTGKKGEAEDGIDLAFCIFDAESTQMQYAGAFRPLIIIRNGELIEYKADKMPCGVYINESPKFTNNVIGLQKGDILYMYSDGIADQFSGGGDMRKFTIRRLKEMLVEVHSRTFEQQKLLIAKMIDDWRKPKGGYGKMTDQVDDILLVGLKIE